jgi:cytochrome c1
MRHLGSKEVQAKNDAGLRKDIVEGTGKMRPIKGLSDKQVNDVVAFLRSLATKQ